MISTGPRPIDKSSPVGRAHPRGGIRAQPARSRAPSVEPPRVAFCPHHPIVIAPPDAAPPTSWHREKTRPKERVGIMTKEFVRPAEGRREASSGEAITRFEAVNCREN